MKLHAEGRAHIAGILCGWGPSLVVVSLAEKPPSWGWVAFGVGLFVASFFVWRGDIEHGEKRDG